VKSVDYIGHCNAGDVKCLQQQHTCSDILNIIKISFNSRKYFSCTEFWKCFQWNFCLSLADNAACYIHAKGSQEGARETATVKSCSFWLQLCNFCKSVIAY